MNVLSQDDVQELLDWKTPPCLSIFLPTERSGPQQQQNPIRLKNVIHRAQQKLQERGVARAEADRLVAPLQPLQADVQAWTHLSEGLACFSAPGFFRCFHLPMPLEEAVYVNDRFHIKPVVPLLGSDARFYILALTQSTAKLYEATRYSIHELALPPLEVGSTRLEPAEQVLLSAGGETSDEVLPQVAVGQSEQTKADILNFFHRVNREVGRLLRRQRAPLVLACVGYLAPIYEAANSYRPLLKVKVPGNPDRWTLDELRSHGWTLVEPYFRRDQSRALNELNDAKQTRRASTDVREVVLAADEGRVGTLFVKKGASQWGWLDLEHRDVKLQPDGRLAGEELLDYAAARTLGNGGEVFLLDEIPQTSSPIAATFRY